MTRYTVQVEVTTTEEFEVFAENDDEAYVKAKACCMLDYHNDFYILDIIAEDD